MQVVRLMARQENHVTRAMEARLKRSRALPNLYGPVPLVPPDLVKWLRLAYPVRCYAFGEETLEDHIKYSGAVALIEKLAEVSGAQHDKDTHEDIFEREDEEVANITISREDQA